MGGRMRTAAWLAGAIVLAGVAAGWVVWTAGTADTRPQEPTSQGAPPPQQLSEVDYRAVRAALSAAPAVTTSEPPPPPLPPAPPPRAWATVEIANPHGAGSIGPGVMAALDLMRPALAECFTPAGQARYAQLGDAASKMAGGNVRRHVGPAIVLLSLEGDGKEMTVVDAPVESRGAASDGTLNCAQSKLRGARLAVPTDGPVRTRFRHILRP